jgi:MraZ protein
MTIDKVEFADFFQKTADFFDIFPVGNFLGKKIGRECVILLFCAPIFQARGRKWEMDLPWFFAWEKVGKAFVIMIEQVMSFFKGQETFSIDDKGRVNVPTKMRKSIAPEAGDTFVLTRGVDKCIVAYPMNAWRVYEEQFARLNQYNERDRFFLRMILSWSEEVEMDAQQRVSLPKRLLELAGIDKKVTIVGMIDHIEFWQPEEFEKYLLSHAESYQDVASKVMTM